MVLSKTMKLFVTTHDSIKYLIEPVILILLQPTIVLNFRWNMRWYGFFVETHESIEFFFKPIRGHSIFVKTYDFIFYFLLKLLILLNFLGCSFQWDHPSSFLIILSFLYSLPIILKMCHPPKEIDLLTINQLMIQVLTTSQNKVRVYLHSLVQYFAPYCSYRNYCTSSNVC